MRKCLGASLYILKNGGGGGSTLFLSPPSPVSIMFTMLFIREQLGNVTHLNNITILNVVITVEMVTPGNKIFVRNVMQIIGYTKANFQVLFNVKAICRQKKYG